MLFKRKEPRGNGASLLQQLPVDDTPRSFLQHRRPWRMEVLRMYLLRHRGQGQEVVEQMKKSWRDFKTAQPFKYGN